MYSEMTIFLYTSIPFTWYAKYNSTANNAEEVNKNAVFRKFGLKFLKTCFLKISLHFLVEDAKPFQLVCEWFFTVNSEGGVGVSVSVAYQVKGIDVYKKIVISEYTIF